jgi:hypothetical protein
MLPREEVERIFVAQLQESGFIPRYGDAESSIALADAVCLHFNHGRSMGELIASAMPGATMSEEEFRGFAAMAAVGFCPEHVSKIVNG